MNVYRISADRARIEKALLRKRMRVISAILMISTFIVPVTLISHSWGTAFRAWLPAALVVTVLCALMMRRTSKLEDELSATFEIIWDGEFLNKKQKNSPDVVLSTSEIISMEEKQGMGFRIRTQSWSKNIWVPCELNEYDAFKTAISSKTGIPISITRNAWGKTYSKVVFYLLGAFIALMATNKVVAAAAAFAVVAAFLWVFSQQVRNPNLSYKGRRLLWVNLAFMLVFLLVVALRLLPQRP